MALNIVPFALCLLFIYRCIYGFWTLYGKFTVELWTGCWILFHKILPQSYVVVAVHSLTVCTLYSLHNSTNETCYGDIKIFFQKTVHSENWLLPCFCPGSN